MIATAHGLEPVVLPEHRPLIFAIFGAGFSAVMFVFALLYRHAYRQRVTLGLNEFEIFETQHSIRRLFVATAIGCTYFGVAGLEALPHRTLGEKRIALGASALVFLMLCGLLTALIRMRLQRNRVKKAWTSRPPEEP
jgi:hypothetical protein